MNADDCNGCSYAQGNGGESSTEQDFYSGLRGPPASSPNSQQSTPHRSHSANSIKVELCSGDESPGAPQPENREAVSDDSRRDDMGDPMEEGSTEYAGIGIDGGSTYNEMASPNSASPGPLRLPNGKLQCEVCGMICIGPNVLMVHKRSHTGERPFQCNQCGASFTQKGNLLRHIKLHSGEKPFKCPVCNYACRRRDALAGHLRTHAGSSPTVGKPFKCSYCSRSYKQQSTLEEHLERCHSYLKSLEHQTAAQSGNMHGEESANMETITKPLLQLSNEKIQSADRLAISITKRKRSTPQKFLGEKHMHRDLPEAPYELSSGSEKEADLTSSQPAVDSAGSAGPLLQGSRGKRENYGPPSPSQLHPAFLTELRTAMASVNSNLTPPGPQARGGGGPAAVSLGPAGQQAGGGRDDRRSARRHITSPNGCPDSTDTESAAEEQSTRAAAPTITSNNHHLHYPTPALPRSRPASSPRQAKDLDPEWERACPAPPTAKRSPVAPLSSMEIVQVLDRDGRPVRSFHCRHCRVLFLDHVMFTIHMGCHGFRQPFECNICGHRSQDRYEFSSHISRGEHQVG
ncbi:zinc finger protein Eos [Gasterosteus aculeatus]|uniref:zinc finger protein Eos n=1 Tax=Gasterosteus aculeatus aculeatus TaxID=481459 RepID=UPI001A97E016|nr:zinc finger protein Eos [Gasterosteus aculeatus aculeatus]XP_040048856.1 zinc finger protein Eos [Gasterosteus aculeatus aculeatus]XP_040048857.1 zinc finger protein Eos [Gasterosteus aculeatus aculeatus]XP_040048858.1 zinc finger protein Eos [Gasterosteus aculeatus aculeatus]